MDAPDETIATRVLFMDRTALVIDKPAGLPVDRPKNGGPALASQLDLLRFGAFRPPSPVHRLDRDTSGCLLLARGPAAHRRFQQAWETGQVEKRYLAIVEGDPAGSAGEIDLPLAKRSTAARGWWIEPDAGGKPARTRWRVLARSAGLSLVAFEPLTGRTHQIRVHAARALGAPVLGDPVYGRAGPAMLLHAWQLALPRTGEAPVAATAPVPARFAAGAPALADALAEAALFHLPPN
jgi:tRNA pseudouridine32 synthase / 23S rRNA pseudouridine746 synthase